MQKKYEVIWAETAQNDLANIIDYIAQDSPSTALKILGKIKKRVSGLALSPERCRIVPELHDQGITIYREMVIDPWRVLYKISGSKVFVLSVLDSRRNLEDILLKRLTHYII
ncbi:MAG: plasmid stabilization protein [Desulfobulbus propionicus]|nr:MAG: plasmid stabilization protein [Desulfobulbus propionicus]